MRVVIFGGRTITDRAILDLAMERAAEKGIVPTVVISGQAPGADALGEAWARDHQIPVEPHPADWDDIEAPGAVIRFRRGRPYNAKAGHDRNKTMGERAEAGVCCWDGQSPGTRDMIQIMRNSCKPVHVELLGEQQPGLFDECDF